MSWFDFIWGPSVDFKVFSKDGEPMTLYFQDSSEGKPVKWNWTFGDGTTSELQNPSHLYTNPGTYVIKMKATYANGNYSSATSTPVKLPSPQTVTKPVMPIAPVVAPVVAPVAPVMPVVAPVVAPVAPVTEPVAPVTEPVAQVTEPEPEKATCPPGCKIFGSVYVKPEGTQPPRPRDVYCPMGCEAIEKFESGSKIYWLLFLILLIIALMFMYSKYYIKK